MATHAKPKPSQIYDEDFYAWSKEQADLLRTRRFAELDLGNLIEQVDDLGGALLEDRSVRLSKAKGIMLASLAVALAWAIFPPWHAPIGSPSGARVTVDQGYAFIGSPPFYLTLFYHPSSRPRT